MRMKAVPLLAVIMVSAIPIGIIGSHYDIPNIEYVLYALWGIPAMLLILLPLWDKVMK